MTLSEYFLEHTNTTQKSILRYKRSTFITHHGLLRTLLSRPDQLHSLQICLLPHHHHRHIQTEI